MGLDEDYAWAALALRGAGYPAVADRLAGCALAAAAARQIERTPMCIAIMAAVDGVDCRQAAALDAVNARRWKAIADDQAGISAAALTFGWVGEVAR